VSNDLVLLGVSNPVVSCASENWMQEGTIPFEPIYEGHSPWFVKLFLVYLAAVLLTSAFRAVRLVWSLRGLQEMKREGADKLDTRFQFLWNSCSVKTASMKNLSALTLLLAFLVCVWRMGEILRGVSMEKATGTTFLAGAAAEALTTFCLGIVVCVILYAFAFFYEAALERCKARATRPE